MRSGVASILYIFGCLALQVYSRRNDCNHLVRLGHCRSNPGYMQRYCWGSCAARSPSSSRTASNCAHWASIGECRKNPAFMLKQCAADCKRQKDKNCRDWANKGECSKNPNYMLKECAKFCSARITVPTCRDLGRNCAYFRRQCHKHNVRQSCRKTCGLCASPKKVAHSDLAPCQDHVNSCPGWARSGYCLSNPKFMLKFCQRSCSCCVDSNSLCQYWVRNFSCRNRGVKDNCKKSCQTCQAFSGGKKTSHKHTKKPGKGHRHTKKPSKGHKHTSKPVTTPPIPDIITEKPALTRPPEHAKTNADICGTRFSIQMMIGGRRANVAEWPWVVGIALAKNATKVICGGSIIADQYILTAAHCFDFNSLKDKRPQDFIVRIGDLNLKEKDVGEHIMGVADRVSHSGFSRTTYDHDIAIIKLKGRLNYSSTARPLCLPSQQQALLADGTRCQAAGWGLLQDEGRQATYLQTATFPIANQAQCNAKFKQAHLPLTENMFCAGEADGEVDACLGDSGGPLFCLTSSGNFLQMGIISWGKGCATKGFHGVFTKVGNYRSWIESSLRKLARGG